ncbi:hypothetical protein GCM10010193_26780 [Kitasatospora atroaurantiaca]
MVATGSCAGGPALLSRVTYPTRYGCLRDSGEELLLRRPCLAVSRGRGLSRAGSAVAPRVPAESPQITGQGGAVGTGAKYPGRPSGIPDGRARVAGARLMPFRVKWRMGSSSNRPLTEIPQEQLDWRKACRPISIRET